MCKMFIAIPQRPKWRLQIASFVQPTVQIQNTLLFTIKRVKFKKLEPAIFLYFCVNKNHLLKIEDYQFSFEPTNRWIM